MHMWKGFRPLRFQAGGTVLADELWLIYTSIIMKEGSAIRIHSSGNGIDVSDANSDNVYGYVTSFKVRNIPLALVSNNSAYVDGTYTDSPLGDTYAAGSGNLTGKQVKAEVVPAQNVVCSAFPDSAPATTANSNLQGFYFDIETTTANRAAQLDESTVTATKTTYLAQPNNLSGAKSVDPIDTRRILVMAVEVQQVEPL